MTDGPFIGSYSVRCWRTWNRNQEAWKTHIVHTVVNRTLCNKHLTGEKSGTVWASPSSISQQVTCGRCLKVLNAYANPKTTRHRRREVSKLMDAGYTKAQAMRIYRGLPPDPSGIRKRPD